MLNAGIIERTHRVPFPNPVQADHKLSAHSRFVLDGSHHTPSLLSSKFRIPPVPVALQVCPLPPWPFFTKVNLQDGFYHFGLATSSRPPEYLLVERLLLSLHCLFVWDRAGPTFYAVASHGSSSRGATRGM